MRQYTEDRDLTAWLVLDQSASMRFGGRPTRQGLGARPTWPSAWPGCSPRAATGSARSSTTTARQRVIPARTGRNHVLRLAHELTRPTGAPIPTARPPTSPRCCGWPRHHRRAGAAWSSSSPTSSATSDWEPAADPARPTATRWSRSGSSTRSSSTCPTSAWSWSRTPRPASSCWPTPATRCSGGGCGPRSAAREAGGGRARCAGPGSTPHRISTDEDLVDALVDMVRRSETQAPMTLPASRAARRRRAGRRGPASRPTAGCSASGPRRAGRRRAGRAGAGASAGLRRHLPYRCCSWPRSSSCCSAVARPQATVPVPAGVRHRDPGLRRVQQHGRRGRRADPARRRPGRRDRASSRSSRTPSTSAWSRSARAR